MKKSLLISALVAAPLMFATATPAMAKSVSLDFSRVFGLASADTLTAYRKDYKDMSDAFLTTNSADYATIKSLQASRNSGSDSDKLAAADKIDALVNKLSADWRDKVDNLHNVYDSKYKAIRTKIISTATSISKGDDIVAPGVLLNAEDITQQVISDLKLGN